MSGIGRFSRFLRGLGPASPGAAVPLVALLGRRLSEPEQAHVTARLLTRAQTTSDALTTADVGAEIVRVTDHLPIDSDVASVIELLSARGVRVRRREQQLH